jgi:16S rRNA (uracil1498-N3)-methyltransferase
MQRNQYPQIRLFTTQSLQTKNIVDLSAPQAHYLINVMRRNIGDKILVFNGCQGEFIAQIQSSGKKFCQILLLEQTRQQTVAPDIFLCFAPVKNAPTDNIIQKATELGVSVIQPVITKHTIVNKLNIERLNRIAIEAAEQSRRLDIPKINDIITLEKLLSNWDHTRKLILCDESGGGAPIAQKLLDIEPLSKKYAALIGPEGGFHDSEFAILRNQPYIVPVSMGPRILRADTAAIVALASLFSILGDWNEKPDFKQY